jgi:hypothetical protein
MSSRQRFTLIILVLFLAGVLISFAALVKRGVEPSAPSQAIEMATQEKTGISLPAEITPPLATVVIPPAQPATETPLPAATVTPLPCPVAVSGGLVTEMRSIVGAMPGAGSNDFILPSNEQIAAWEVIVRAAALGDAPTACAIIQAYGFPYQVVQFTDTPFEDQEYILLREVEPVNAGWGTYIFHADAKTSPIVIEVPHPAVDWNTEIEGVEMFRKLNARALLVAGTDRCASNGFSSCTGTTIACGQVEPYRISDVAHNEQNMFQAAHRVLVACDGKTVAIQLHVNSVGNCQDIFISNGTTNPGALSGNIADSVTKSCGDYTVDLADGSAGECAFTGGAAPQAVFTNGCGYSPPPNACTDYVLRPSGLDQFISIEQSVSVEKDFDCLVNALEKVFKP